MSPVKHAQTKAPSKKLAKPAKARSEEEQDEAVEPVPVVSPKIKPAFAFDEDESLPLADKGEDLLAGDDAESEDDASEDEAVLDEEELNPFGDKWEQ